MMEDILDIVRHNSVTRQPRQGVLMTVVPIDSEIPAAQCFIVTVRLFLKTC